MELGSSDTIQSDYKQFYTLSQASKVFSLPRETIKRMVQTGKIDGFKPTYKTYLVCYQSLMTYIKSTKVQPLNLGDVLVKGK